MHILNNPGRPAGRQHRRLVLAALAATALSLSQIQIAAADATISIDAASTLPQNGGDVLPTLKNIFQSGNAPGNVSSYPDPLADQMLPLMADLGVKRARLLLMDDDCDIDAQGNFGGKDFSGNFAPGHCLMLDWQIGWLTKANLSPHMAVASHMPKSFAEYGPAESWGDKTLKNSSKKIIDHYRDYAKALVRYIATTAFAAGAQTAVFEVSNEIDIASDYPPNYPGCISSSNCVLPLLGPWGRWLWWIDPVNYNMAGFAQAYAMVDEDNLQLGFPAEGDVRRLGRGLLPVQKIFSDAILVVNAELEQSGLYNGKTIEIAGPAMAGITLIKRPQGAGPSLEEQFIDQTFNPSASPYNGKFNAHLDRFSFHYYGSAEALRIAGADKLCTTDVPEPFNLFEQMVTAYKTKLSAVNMSNVPLFLSEWGATACDGGEVNYSHKGAAWVAAFLPEALAQGVTMGSFLTVEDRLVYGGPGATSLLGGASLWHTYGSGTSYTFLPKAPTNVFKMYTLMSGLRNQVTVTPTAGSHLNAFVTSDQSSTSVMVYNFDPYLVFNNDANTRTGTAENFSISVSNIFKMVGGYNGPVRVKRYQVDATTSNLKNFIDYANTHSGNTSGAPDPSLQLIEDYPATAVNGTVQLESSPSGAPAKPLGLGVTLYRITLN